MSLLNLLLGLRFEDELQQPKQGSSTPAFTKILPSPQELDQMILEEFAQSHLIVCLWSRLLQKEIWFVSGMDEASALHFQGKTPAQVYTAHELEMLLKLCAKNLEEIHYLFNAIKFFNGTIKQVLQFCQQQGNIENLA